MNISFDSIDELDSFLFDETRACVRAYVFQRWLLDDTRNLAGSENCEDGRNPRRGQFYIATATSRRGIQPSRSTVCKCHLKRFSASFRKPLISGIYICIYMLYLCSPMYCIYIYRNEENNRLSMNKFAFVIKKKIFKKYLPKF